MEAFTRMYSGVFSRNFCRDDTALVLGNDLLAEVEPDYAIGISRFRVSTHTVSRVLRAIHITNTGEACDYPTVSCVVRQRLITRPAWDACKCFHGEIVISRVQPARLLGIQFICLFASMIRFAN